MAKKATKSTNVPLETYLLLAGQGVTATITVLLATLALATVTAASVSLGQIFVTVSENSFRNGETLETNWLDMYLGTIQQATIVFAALAAILLFIGLKTLKNRPNNTAWTVTIGSITATALAASLFAEQIIAKFASLSQ